MASKGRATVEVWHADIRAAEDVWPRVIEALSPDERRRADRLSEAARRAFVVGRGLVRSLLAKRLGVEPREVQLAYEPHGKPYALAPNGARAPGFNVAHSHDAVVVAICDEPGISIGIDIEWTGAPRRIDAIVRRYASAREAASFFSLAQQERRDAFWRWWTRKEAWVKAEGIGLARGLDAVEAPFDAAPRHRVGRWTLHTWTLGARYVVTLAVPGETSREASSERSSETSSETARWTPGETSPRSTMEQSPYGCIAARRVYDIPVTLSRIPS